MGSYGRHGTARHGMGTMAWARARARARALHGTARHRTAWNGMALCVAWHGNFNDGTARHGTARHGAARHGTAQHGTARRDNARLDMANGKWQRLLTTNFNWHIWQIGTGKLAHGMANCDGIDIDIEVEPNPFLLKRQPFHLQDPNHLMYPVYCAHVSCKNGAFWEYMMYSCILDRYRSTLHAPIDVRTSTTHFAAHVVLYSFWCK